MSARTNRMDAVAVATRAAQARAFLDSARLHVGDSAPSNSVAGTAAVHAGIAAGDAICGKILGFCSRGENHDEAIDLLARALPDRSSSKNLARLLGKKALAGYSAEMLSDRRTSDLVMYAERLVEAMERVLN